MNQITIRLSAHLLASKCNLLETKSTANFMLYLHLYLYLQLWPWLYLFVHMQIRLKQICMAKSAADTSGSQSYNIPHKNAIYMPYIHIYILYILNTSLWICFSLVLKWNAITFIFSRRRSKNCCANILYAICIDILSNELCVCFWVCVRVCVTHTRTLNHGDCDFVVKVRI